MCRWLAYSGSPIRLEELLVKRDRSLIDQSLHARQGATPTNGDGFGVGWYEDGDGLTPRLYSSTVACLATVTIAGRRACEHRGGTAGSPASSPS
jgi:predicted glutamine amidotransferase